MDPALPLELRKKYRLVHVPRRDRILRWVTSCRASIELGVPVEHAGTVAAREVFPYEAGETPAPEGRAVPDLLDMVD